ncbi:helix-turn-helix transcriptional regulator [Proteus mirabilis]|uniref:helix-turn-helix domain-containing protein n=2 Tax=Gammaproteobacteria TaxID=1236 RepID=UPI000DFA32E9|nr:MULTISPECIES: helix-turn-helix transcriptional regulator [Proteus]ELA7740710.1 helix-turn-helix transcriptional regulator [Proteus mirabilis]MBG2905382.1 helix-turn-helix transcriptional regulator [Proteus mirabilis]MBG3156664.1 helix-turn-helix transcriptional regulator [Proteus mirabilis]MBG5994296.1 helix-turn-helix transcriptional regulator [Proteus mirabilis]MBI6207652.1 helix-turn-helix transcriptional regulator [Proteus mirabilis]
MSTVSERLKKIIDELGIRQNDVANLTNLSQQTINYILKKGVEKSFYTYQIALGLGVNPEWLAHGIGKVYLEKSIAIPCYNSILDLKIDLPNLKRKTLVKDIPIVIYSFSVYLDSHNLVICGIAPDDELDTKEYLCIHNNQYSLIENVENKDAYDLCFLVLEKRKSNLKNEKFKEVNF